MGPGWAGRRARLSRSSGIDPRLRLAADIAAGGRWDHLAPERPCQPFREDVPIDRAVRQLDLASRIGDEAAAGGRTVAFEPAPEAARIGERDRHPAAGRAVACRVAPSSPSSRRASARASMSGSRRGPVQAGQPASQAHDAISSAAADQLVMAVPQPLGQPDPARDRLVEVDRRLLGVRGADLAHEAQVARVDHEQDARHRLDRPTGTKQGDIELVPSPAVLCLFGGQPVRGRLELDLGQVDRTPTDVLVGQELQLLVERDEAGHHHLAVDAPAARRGRLREDVERLERHGPVGVGVVVGVDPVDVRLALAPFEPVDVVLDRLVE